MNKILVTGAAGFIGFHLIKKLAEFDYQVVGLDNLNDYYDVELKLSRLKVLGFNSSKIENNKTIESDNKKNIYFVKANLQDKNSIENIFRQFDFDVVVNLAAQAGVRYSITNPDTYIETNLVGFFNILEACRNANVRHLVFASSSSVYGLNTQMPFSTKQNVDHPISLYAATKKSNEILAHSYSYLYNLPVTGLRFFTVYGPWGRPDMALFKFTKAILAGLEIDVYNFGNMKRDFTYIDDIIDGIYAVMQKAPSPALNLDPIDPSMSLAPYKIYNIGNGNPVNLLDFIHAIEKFTGKKAKLNLMEIQPGDVPATWADMSDFKHNFGFFPKVNIYTGVKNFIEWYFEYYGVKL